MTTAALATCKQTAPFLMIPHHLLQAPGFISRTTNEVLDLNLTQLVIFQWMKGSYDSYTGKGGRYHESQASIAKACRTSRATVIRAMELFEQHGYLSKNRKWEGCVWQLPHSLEVAQEAPEPVVKEAPTPAANDAPEIAQVSKPSQPAANDDDDVDIFGPVAGSYGGPVEDDRMQVDDQGAGDEAYAAIDYRVYDSVDVDVSTTSTGTAPGNAFTRFLAAQPKTSSTHYADYNDREYGYASDEDGPF